MAGFARMAAFCRWGLFQGTAFGRPSNPAYLEVNDRHGTVNETDIFTGFSCKYGVWMFPLGSLFERITLSEARGSASPVGTGLPWAFS